MVRPEFRNASSRSRRSSSAKSNSVLVKVAGLGLNVTSVPLACVGTGPTTRQRRLGVAVAEPDEMLLAVAPDAHLHPLRQRVHHRRADAVQPAGHLVGVLVEFARRRAAGSAPPRRRRCPPPRGCRSGCRARRRAPSRCRRRSASARHRVAKPACASSTALSMISNAMWCRPEPSSVSPIYMPGRRRTASSPRRTEMDDGVVGVAVVGIRIRKAAARHSDMPAGDSKVLVGYSRYIAATAAPGTGVTRRFRRRKIARSGSNSPPPVRRPSATPAQRQESLAHRCR